MTAILNEDGTSGVRPMTDDELAFVQELQSSAAAARLAADRDAKIAEIQAALASTDVWIHRAVEEGIALPAPRKAYREQLRELLLQAQASDDPAAVEIPSLPAWVPGKS